MKQEIFDFLDSLKMEEDLNQKESLKDFKEYYCNFFSNYSLKNLHSLSSLSNYQLMELLAILTNPFEIKEIITALAKYPNLIDNDIFQAFIYYFHDPDFKETVDKATSLNPFNYVPAIWKLNKMLLEVGLLPRCNKIIFFIQKHPSAPSDLACVFKNFSKSIYNLGIKFILERDNFNALVNHNERKKIFDALPRVQKKTVKETLLKEYKRGEKSFSLVGQSLFRFINERHNRIIKNYEQEAKKRRHSNCNLDGLKKLLDTENEITNIDQILKLCENDEVISRVVDYIYNHNKECYQSLLSELEAKKEKNDTNLGLFFQKFGFDYETLNDLDRKTVKRMKYNEIESLLSRLKFLNLEAFNLSKIDLTKLSLVESLIYKGIINKEWLRANIYLLYNDNNKLEQVKNNLDLLSKSGINMLQYQPDLDITKSLFLKVNLEILKLYELTITRNTTSISFLSASDFRDRIELFISTGFYKYCSSLDLLNKSREEIYLEKIASTLDIGNGDFLASDPELIFDFGTHLIPSDIKTSLEGDILSDITLPEFVITRRIDNKALDIDGILVSINKVKRNLSKLGRTDPESCFYAIVYNGFYTYEEVEKLRSYLIPEKTFFNLVRK